MQTVGSILRKARQKKGITLEQVEKATKIHRKYLLALEKDDIDNLPESAYIIGFIKIYSQFLQLDGNRLLAIYRRDYGEYKKPEILPKNLKDSLDTSFFTITPRRAAIISSILFLAIFFTYLFIEYRFISAAPKLSVDSPIENQVVYRDKIVVKGHSDPDSQVRINDQPVILQVDGTFSVEVVLTPGINDIKVVATNKFGKSALISRTVEYKAP